MGNDTKTIGNIKVNIGISYQKILDMKIMTKEGTHGKLYLEMEINDGMQKNDILSLVGQRVKVTLDDGTRLFAGNCTSAGLENTAEYKCVKIEAASDSIQMDKEPKDRVFQDPGKTLKGIADEIGSSYGAEITLDSDVTISHIVSQNKETDWEFLRRIAAAEGKVLYTDILEDNIRIFIGKTGLREFTDNVLENAQMTRDVSELASMEANEGSGEGYMTDLMQGESTELTMSAGDNAGVYTVRSGEIAVEKGVLVNRVSYGYPDSIRPTVDEISQPGLANSVLQGTVTAVSGNMVQVQFDADSGMGSPTWIPYESAISNSFYSMPDEGDRVFVYYENNGKMACLGSHHMNTDHPDMQKPEEKVLTNKDKMIKLATTSIKLSATRKLTDDESANAVSIVMDDDSGITINSGREIQLATQKNLQFGVGNLTSADSLAQSGKEKLEARIEEGKQAFAAQGGYISLVAKQLGGQFIDQAKAGYEGHFMNFFFQKEEDQETPPPDAETYENGVLTLYGYQGMTLSVGGSSITLDTDIHINTSQFQWLGYERMKHEKQEQPLQDWWETALDGLQFVLDLAGMLPAPVGMVCDLVNAGVSLARGDYAGAALSLVSSIPIVGDSLGAAKIAGKAAKTVIKSADTLKKVEKMMKVAQGLYMMAQGAYNIYLNKDGWAEIFQKLDKGENPFMDPACVSTMLNTAGGAVMFARGAKGVSDATGLTDKVKNAVKGDSSKEQNTTQTGTNTKQKNDNDCGDPINVVTGSLMMDYHDLTLHDIREDFELHRIHESIHTNEGMMLGNRWFLNIETRLHREGDTITVQRTDMHLETFHLEDGNWKNARNGDCSVTLQECDGGYLFREAAEQKKYMYRADGRIACIEDACGNRTEFRYEGDVLARMNLASGQFLEFSFENGRLKKIQDTLGRQICYEYEGNLLTGVTMPNGGVIRYTYTNTGLVHTATDQNGNTYMTCEYDRKGRVVRQTLPTGEEYVLHYDDAERKNRFTNLKNGQHIIYEYGRQRVPLREVYPDGTYTEKRYDDWENCIYERDALGNETHREYDIHGNLLHETAPDGAETFYTYDENNRMIRRQDSTGACEEWEYDRNGNMTVYRQRIEGELYATTSYTYDSRGRVLTLTNPNGNTVRYSYNHNFSGPTLKTLPEGETEHFSYDAAGRLMEKEDHTGRTGYGYNRRDKITSVTDALGNCTRYRYDLLGNLLEVRPPVQEAAGLPGIRYTYDALDRRISQMTPEGNLYLYDYGNEECLTLSIHPNAAAKGKKDGICYDYDEQNRRIRAHYPDGGCERYFYDNNGNLIKRVTPECYDSASDDGDGYTYTYDCMNRITSITNPLGEEESAYRYDHAGRITGYREGKEQPESIYTYNHAGWLVSVRKPMERTEDGSIRYRLTTYGYDAMGNRTQEKRYLDYQTEESAAGKVNTITYTYNRSNLPVRVEDSTGAGMEYFYDGKGRLVRELSRLYGDTFREIRYIMDETGRTLKYCVKLEEEAVYTGNTGYAVTEYCYDGNGNVTKITLPEGGTASYTYDNDNRVITECHEEKKGGISNRISYAYDHAGNRTSQTDAEGNTTVFTYDYMDRETWRTAPDGGTTTRTYDRNGNLIREVMPQEHASAGVAAQGYRYAYDPAGRRLTTTAPDGSLLEQNTYDAAGRLVRQLEGAEYSYDLAGRQTVITAPGGSRQQFVYDALGSLTETTDGMGNTTAFTVDAWGRTTHIRKADGSHEAYTYDHAGNMLSAEDGEGHKVTYTYNCRGLLESRTDAAGCTEHFRYDSENNLAESTDRNGSTIRCSYNMYGSLTSRRSSTGDISETFGYYPDGKLKFAIGGGMRYDYVYDVMGRLSRKLASGRSLLGCAYDLDGNRTAVTDITGKTTQYHYDTIGRLTEITDNGRRQARYTYNPDGTIRTLEVGEKGVLHTEYAYDRDKNVISQKTVVSGMGDITALPGMPVPDIPDAGRTMTLVDNTYRYDGNANCIEKHTLSGLNRYTYDSLGQLVKAEYPTGTEAYSYDRAGNRLTRTTQNSREEYRHDAAGRLTGRSVYEMPKSGDIPTAEQNMVETKTYQYDYDRQGNTLSDGENTYRYDSLNRLVEIRTKNGDIQRNHYDGEGLRAELEENGRLVSFIFDNEKAVCETDADRNTIRYIRGYELISSDSEKAKTYYHYASDELGSTTHVTDEAGKILNRYEYDAFGNFTVKEEKVENRFCFTGEQYDPASNLYYLRARFYSPVIGRFLNEDTYYGDGLNLYAYCHNNPVGYVDPSGHKSYPYEYFPNLFDDVPNPSTGPKPSDSTNLGKNIFEYVGIDVNTTGTGSHQKQHLIPQQVYVNSQFLQDIGFNIDSHWNGIFDKNMKMGSTTINDIFKANNVSKELTDRYVSDKTNHNGRHAKYNDAVEREVEKIQKKAEKLRDISYEQYVKYGQREIAILVEDLRTMNRDGINLYRCEDGKSNDPDEYYEEFKKKKQEAHEKNWHQKY